MNCVYKQLFERIHDDFLYRFDAHPAAMQVFVETTANAERRRLIRFRNVIWETIFENKND